jgi:hypothetical protein
MSDRSATTKSGRPATELRTRWQRSKYVIVPLLGVGGLFAAIVILLAVLKPYPPTTPTEQAGTDNPSEQPSRNPIPKPKSADNPNNETKLNKKDQVHIGITDLGTSKELKGSEIFLTSSGMVKLHWHVPESIEGSLLLVSDYQNSGEHRRSVSNSDSELLSCVVTPGKNTFILLSKTPTETTNLGSVSVICN